MVKGWEKNCLAIAELMRGNESCAINILRENIKRNPNCVTFNNIGVYYSQYGMLLNNGKVRNAQKIGLKYLLKASLYETNWCNYVSIATAYFKEENIIAAYSYFKQAYLLNKDDTILYNIGCCLFRLRRYEEAITIFDSLHNIEFIDFVVNSGGANIIIILAYCQIKLNNIPKCKKYIEYYRNIWKTEDLLDVFNLRYLCGMYEEALSEYKQLLNEWYPTKYMLNIIGECAKRVPSYDISEIMLNEEYKINKKCKGQIFNTVGYSFLPPIISMYKFIV